MEEFLLRLPKNKSKCSRKTRKYFCKIYSPMTYNPNIHHRRSIRLKEYDYSQNGAYFVTICVQNRECLFGEIVDGEMVLNDAGK